MCGGAPPLRQRKTPPRFPPSECRRWPRSKVKLYPELELPGRIGSGRNRPEVWRLHACDRNCPNWSIRRVKHLEPKFESESFCNGELAEDRKVQILVPVRAKRIPA